jgi:hypothetical protein
MLDSMRTRLQSRQWLVMWALPVALWAAIPAIRWCPPGWQQACAAAILRCSAMNAPAACPRAANGCPLAAAGSSAMVNDGCPEASRCPMAPATPATAPSRREPFPAGGAFCVGDPNGGAALRAHAPQLEPASSLPAIVPDSRIGPGATTLADAIPQLASRPPPRPWLRRPPARAPPSLRLT